MKINKPAIVLIRPQLPENIGLVARAMDNCGLKKLIIVKPREKWPNPLAIKSAANSKKIILESHIFENIETALEKFHIIIATSNRKRLLKKPFIDNHNTLFENFDSNKKIAILFGPENSGLSNEDLMLADIIFKIRTDKSNTSLNISHAVVLMSYLWRDHFILSKKNMKINNNIHNKIAYKKDFIFFMQYLKKELENAGFLYPEHKAKSMFENIQTMLLRSSLSKIEIQTLWGMIKKLRK